SAPNWQIERSEAGQREAVQGVALRDWAEYVWSPWWLVGISFDEAVKRPGFKLESVEPTGTGFITVKFTYSPSEQERKQPSRINSFWALRAGRLVLSPEEHWSLIESEITIQDHSTKTVVEYGERVGKFRTPKRVKETETGSGYTYEVDVVIDR